MTSMHLRMFASAATMTELDEQYVEATNDAALFADAAGTSLARALSNTDEAYQVRKSELLVRVA